MCSICEQIFVNLGRGSRGVDEAAAQIWQIVHPTCTRIATMAPRDHKGVAEEAIQVTCVNVLTAIKKGNTRFDPHRCSMPYFKRIAVNATLDIINEQTAYSAAKSQIKERDPRVPTALDPRDSSLRQDLFEKTIAYLRDRYDDRAIAALVMFSEDIPTRTIAKELGYRHHARVCEAVSEMCADLGRKFGKVQAYHD